MFFISQLFGSSIASNIADVDFSSWVLTPLLITFLLPGVIVLLLYLTALILYICKWHWKRLKQAYESDNKWDKARKLISAIWDGHGWIWHGYEIKGVDNIPESSPALIIYYHGAIPVDIYYFIARIMLFRNRLIHTVADNFLFKIPGFGIISEAIKVIPGTVQTCANILKEGNLLAISPGGVYESQFSHNYGLMWKKRLGFARVAIEAKVPIIPIFTENLREAFRAVSWPRRMWLKLYSLTKFPCSPVYGGFPVKLTTHVGQPIPYDPDLTPEQLQMKVAEALASLIREHQRTRGSVLYSLLERVPYLRSKLKQWQVGDLHRQ